MDRTIDQTGIVTASNGSYGFACVRPRCQFNIHDARSLTELRAHITIHTKAHT